MDKNKSVQVKDEQKRSDWRAPICSEHKLEMEMITYNWGEVEFVCPKGHIV